MMNCSAVILVLLLLYASTVSCDKDYYERREGLDVFAIQAVACAIGAVLGCCGCIFCYTKYCDSEDEDEQQENPETDLGVRSAFIQTPTGGNPLPAAQEYPPTSSPPTAPCLPTPYPPPPTRPSYQSYPSESLPTYEEAVQT